MKKIYGISDDLRTYEGYDSTFATSVSLRLDYTEDELLEDWTPKQDVDKDHAIKIARNAIENWERLISLLVHWRIE